MSMKKLHNAIKNILADHQKGADFSGDNSITTEYPTQRTE